ncbi:MAG: lipid-A-disaccharide synthase [Kiritimatiellae bacterium]|nr:lipid-A-disaccharide synthase [Kiritimatiellia bacterium]
METAATPLKILICAGEPSGDLHAAALMASLRNALPRPIHFRGFGGDRMRAAGAELLYHTDQTALIGITPVLLNLPFLLGMMRRLKREILTWKPDLVLTVDYPGMNLRLAAFAHRNGFLNVHYICPQVWAWHRGRIPKIARMMDQLLCIFPFEPELFRATGLDVRFTGHPLVDRAAETRAETPLPLPWSGRHKVALLPGSRASEITRILPRLLKAARLLQDQLDGACSFIIPAASPKIRRLAERVIAESPEKPDRLAFVDGQARQVLAQADAAAVTSGTATLEACLMRCPTVLVYAASLVTYCAARLLVKGVTHLGLANIIAGRTVMPELLQQAFTPERLAEQLRLYLTDPAIRAQTLADLNATNAKLGAGGATDRAAAAIGELMEKRRER